MNEFSNLDLMMLNSKTKTKKKFKKLKKKGLHLKGKTRSQRIRRVEIKPDSHIRGLF